MRVTVDIPDNDWALLVARAEAHGLRVPDLIRAGINDVMPHGLPLNEHVRLLVTAGYPDKAIGARLNLTNEQVARIRRTHGLAANRITPTNRTIERNTTHG